MSKSLLALSLAALALAPVGLAAQVVVGHLPENSPYSDIAATQRLTFFGGYFATQQTATGAAPQSGPALGLRYDIPVAGPADFFVKVQRVSSHRDAYDPTLPAETRSLGRQNLPLYNADLGFDMNLTGRRTWHGLIPVLGFGLGVVSATGTTAKDPYSFGTQFSFSGDAGVRIVPGNFIELRFDASPVFYQNHYPSAYYVTPANSTPILATSQARSGFQHAIAYTAGLSVAVFR
ncbi:MAG: hypothetical protein M3R65_09810 [Gemmatimonadota bacterium]|nr:hypothetical protein [Gemmatimonadota bacterium]